MRTDGLVLQAFSTFEKTTGESGHGNNKRPV